MKIPKWQRKLNSEERKHLREIMEPVTLAGFKRTREFQAVMRAENKARGYSNTEPCFCCRQIALTLKLEE